ncbi:MAG: FAD-binding oxidoreductase [Candidatus Binataceae bacterium]
MLTRRQFLIKSAQLVAGVGMGGALLGTAGCTGSSGAAASGPAWKDLAQRISGPVLRPWSAGFAKLAQPNNLRYASKLPAGIARCVSANDAAQAIAWSRENDIRLAARSGGHSYAGYSSTEGLMMDLSLMNQADYDPSSGIVMIGGGIRNVDLYSALQAAEVTITHGRCPTVGGAAFLLGGGIGFNMRRFGLACDLMTETELVTADGEILTLNQSDNSSLFWACRGGAGGNFGINTSFSLMTFPTDELTVFNIVWSDHLEELYPALISALQDAPPELGSRLALSATAPEQFGANSKMTVTLLGQLVGTPGDLADILAPAYQASEPAQETIQQMSYWDAQDNFLAEPGLPARYQERSGFFTGPPDSAAIDAAFSWARNWPGTSASANFVLFQTGEQVNAKAPDATAFVHRNSDWLMTIALDWGPADSPATVQRNLEWQANFYQAMRKFTTGAYQNFPDPSLSTWQQDYYGANLPMLEAIKAEVDPDRVFTFPQGIRPVPPTATRATARNRIAARTKFPPGDGWEIPRAA